MSAASEMSPTGHRVAFSPSRSVFLGVATGRRAALLRSVVLTAVTSLVAGVAVAGPVSAGLPSPAPMMPTGSVAVPDDAVTLVVGTRKKPKAADVAVASLDRSPVVQVQDAEPVVGLSATTVTVAAGDAVAAAALLRSNPDVTYVEPVARYEPVANPSDPYFSLQWGLQKVNAPTAWDRTTGTSDVVVAVLDTGVNAVSELSGRVLPGYDFYTDDTDPADDDGHGTNSSSVIAAAGNNSAGIAGMCWTCKILPGKVLGKPTPSSDSTGSSTDIAEAIVWATDQGADVINMSLGSSTYTQVMADAVAYAIARDVVVVASAGNSSVSTRFYPAGYPGVIAVASSDQSDVRAPYSNFGTVADPWVDVAAPGTNPAQNNTGSFVYFTGTSSAGPVVAGVAALARSLKASASEPEIRAAITGTAVPVGGWVQYGRVDAAAVLQRLVPVSNPNPGPSPSPSTSPTTAPTTAPTVAPTTTTPTTAPTAAPTTAPTTKPSPTVAPTRTTPPKDTTPPKVTAVRAGTGTVSRGAVPLAATVSDDVKVTGLTFIVDAAGRRSTVTGNPATGSASWNSGTFSGTATITATARDAAGNTASATTTVTVDNQAPTVAAAVPAYVTGTVTVPVTTAATDLARVELIVGTTVVTRTTAPWNLTWNTTKSIQGPVTVTVKATDTAGNTFSVPLRTAVSNTGPALQWPAVPAEGALLSKTVTITPKVVSAIPVTKMELLGGDQVIASSDRTPWTLTYQPPGSATGSRTLSLRATNAAGLTTTVTRNITVDTQAPVITALGLPREPVLRGPATITPGVYDAGSVATVEVTLSQGGRKVAGSKDVTSPWSVTVPTINLNGQATVTVTVTDSAGNTASQSGTVTIDNIAPVVDVMTPSVARGMITLDLRNPAPDLALLEVTTGGRALAAIRAAPWSVTIDTTALPASATLTFKATDTTGNVTSLNKTLKVDNVAPQRTRTTLKNGATVPAIVPVTTTATDAGTGLARIEYLVGGRVVAVAERSGTVVQVPVNATAGTQVSIITRTTDKVGNSAEYSETVVISDR